jgi:PAS domain S-box-containing protein
MIMAKTDLGPNVSSPETLSEHVRQLEHELAEARELLEAIRHGEVDAIVVSERDGDHRVYTLETADRPYRFLIEQMQEGAITLNAEGTILYCNRRAAEMFGAPQEQITGKQLSSLLDSADSERLIQLLDQARRSGVRSEFTIRNRSARAIPVYISASPFLDGNTPLLAGVLTDLTEQKRRLHALAEANERLTKEIAERERAEEALRQGQKMQAIGELTGGIAHDFNNLLQSISGALFVGRRRIEEGRAPDAADCLDLASRSVTRAASLTHRLLAFSRRQMLVVRRVDIQDLLTGLASLFAETVGPQINVETRLKTECWPVRCDPNQLESALLNLVINARDAMLPNGGNLFIETGHESLDERQTADSSGARPGDFVRITVTDTGKGMPEPVRERAFEPFFTTKPAGQGTGLGLSQVYGFVNQSNGVVRLQSQEGRGTSVHVYLPRDVESVDEVGRKPAAPAQVPLTDAKILLVEDEQDIRQLIAEALQDSGLTAVEAADASAALRVLQELGAEGAPDLLLADIGLPGGLNGRQLADEARQIFPALPVLLITGYAGAASSSQLPAGVQVLSKPFNLDALVARVREMLAGPDSRLRSIR